MGIILRGTQELGRLCYRVCRVESTYYGCTIGRVLGVWFTFFFVTLCLGAFYGIFIPTQAVVSSADPEHPVGYIVWAFVVGVFSILLYASLIRTCATHPGKAALEFKSINVHAVFRSRVEAVVGVSFPTEGNREDDSEGMEEDTLLERRPLVYTDTARATIKNGPHDVDIPIRIKRLLVGDEPTSNVRNSIPIPDTIGGMVPAPYCQKCDIYKFEGIHHCSSCGECILHMDHHCPWMGQCIGKTNHKYFVLFLSYTSICALLVSTAEGMTFFHGNGHGALAVMQVNGLKGAIVFAAWMISLCFGIILIPFTFMSLSGVGQGVTTIQRMIEEREKRQASSTVHRRPERPIPPIRRGPNDVSAQAEEVRTREILLPSGATVEFGTPAVQPHMFHRPHGSAGDGNVTADAAPINDPSLKRRTPLTFDSASGENGQQLSECEMRGEGKGAVNDRHADSKSNSDDEYSVDELVAVRMAESSPLIRKLQVVFGTGPMWLWFFPTQPKFPRCRVQEMERLAERVIV